MNSYEHEDARRGYEQSVDAPPEDYAWSEWLVYPEYDVGEHEGRRFIYAPMTDPLRQLRERRRYRPLSRPTAALFLEFARWPETEGMDRRPFETERNEAAAKEWAEINGVLGLSPSPAFSIMGTASEAVRDYLGTYAVAYQTRNEGYGGREETVEAFAVEAWLANMALRLYEAATSPEGLDVNAIVGYMSDEADNSLPNQPSTRALHGETPERAQEWALQVVEEIAESRLRGRVWPIAVRQYSGQGSYAGHKQGWAFDSLLGAMWLQMLWLMLGRPRRCEWCGKLLDVDTEQDLESAADTNISGKRKPRRDRRFCDNNGRCRAAWNYHRGVGKSGKAVRKKRRESGSS